MITEVEWQAFMDDFQQTLDKFRVPQAERDELNAIVESTKDGVVVAPPFQEDQQPRLAALSNRRLVPRPATFALLHARQ